MSIENAQYKSNSFEEILGQPDLCGLEEFADFFNRQRANIIGSPKYEHLTDDDVKFLISLAYYASTIAEEGRYPKFRFFHYPYNQKLDEQRTMVLFDSPRLLKSVKDVHRLIPAVSSLDYALKITKIDSEFYCDAIILVDDAELFMEIGTSNFQSFAGLTGISIRVDGPGDITIAQNADRAQTFRLYGGRAEKKVPLRIIDDFENWVALVSKNFVSIYLTAEKEQSTNPHFDIDAQRGIESLIKFFWESLLQKTTAAKHGGAFILIPHTITSEQLESKYNINLKYKTKDLNIGKIITDFFRHSKELFNIEMTVEKYTEEDLYKDFNPRAWQYTKKIFLSTVQAIANLANVDGCVVLDGGMNVLGFGGEIRETPISLTESINFKEKIKNFIDPHGMRFFSHPPPVTEEDLKGFGTRHRSAARLCKANPYTLAFVISQDGDLRLFTSDDGGNLFFYKQIAASNRRLEAS